MTSTTMTTAQPSDAASASMLASRPGSPELLRRRPIRPTTRPGTTSGSNPVTSTLRGVQGPVGSSCPATGCRARIDGAGGRVGQAPPGPDHGPFSHGGGSPPADPVVSADHGGTLAATAGATC